MKDVLEMMSVCLTKTFQDSIVCAIEDYARHEDILGWVLQTPHSRANRFEPARRVLQCRTPPTIAVR